MLCPLIDGRHSRNFRCALQITLILAVVLIGSARRSDGQTFQWNATQGFWQNASGWSPAGPPVPGSTAQFSLNLTDTVGFNASSGNPTIGQLFVLSGNYKFDNSVASAVNLTVTGAAANAFQVTGVGTVMSLNGLQLAVTNSNLLIGDGATLGVNAGSGGALGSITSSGHLVNNGTLNVSGGTSVSSASGVIGLSFTQSGFANVSGAGSTWSNSGNLEVGRFGGGTLNITNGAVVTNVDGILGNNVGSSGNAKVSGNGSRWSNSGDLTIGNLGNSNLTIENGGRVFNDNGFIARNPGTGGTVTVDGANSLWKNASELTIGEFGTLNITNGGRVESHVGRLDGLVSRVNVTGLNSSWHNSGELIVGDASDGILKVEDGGSLSSTSGTVGRKSGSHSLVSIDGANSQWTTSSTLRIGDDGEGGVVVTNGGRLTVAHSLFAGFNGTGTLEVSDGGVVDSLDGFVGRFAGSTGTASVSGVGSQWNNAFGLDVGSFGDGDLTIENGGLVTSSGGLMAANAGSSGNVTVTGLGSIWNDSATIRIGASGVGNLNILDQGVVFSDHGIVGSNFGSSGAVVVSGAGSVWSNTNTLTVGKLGVGSLTVDDGGLVLADRADIGLDEGLGDCTLEIDGSGSQMFVLNDFRLGVRRSSELFIRNGGQLETGATVSSAVSGPGTFGVDGANSKWTIHGDAEFGRSGFFSGGVVNGGQLLSQNASIGGIAGFNHTFAAFGAGSRWDINGDLSLGHGTMLIQNGAVITNQDASIAKTNGQSFSVEVAEADAHWANSGNLYVGGTTNGAAGTGTLNIKAAGRVSVAGTTRIFSTGTVNLEGGRFEFGQMLLQEFGSVNATGGSMAGSIAHTGFTNVASLTPFHNSAVDLRDVHLVNSGRLFGTSAVMGTSLLNTSSGELLTTSGEFVRFAGGLDNAGELNNFGGIVRFDELAINRAAGFIAGRGQFIADGGWSNQGVMAFSGGFTDVLGDVELSGAGSIVTSGGGLATFYDDVIHNGAEIRTSALSHTVFFGSVSGAGPFNGIGDVYFEGDLRPGNSPATVDFEGNVHFGTNATTMIELGGLSFGEFDQLRIAGDLELAGALSVGLINGFRLTAGNEFLIVDLAGSRFGQFSGLQEGALVGTFSGRDLYVTYQAGSNGRGIGLYTAIPEPTTGAGLFAVLVLCGMIGRKPNRSLGNSER